MSLSFIFSPDSREVKIPKIKLKQEEGGGIKKEKESRSKQTRPFTSKVAKLLKVGYVKPVFKHTATNAGHFYGYVNSCGRGFPK